MFAKLSEAYARLSGDGGDTNTTTCNSFGSSKKNNNKSVELNENEYQSNGIDCIGQSMSIDEAKSFYISVFGKPSEQEGLELYSKGNVGNHKEGQQREQQQKKRQQSPIHDDSSTQASSLISSSPPRAVTTRARDVEMGSDNEGETLSHCSESHTTELHTSDSYKTSRSSLVAEGFKSSLLARDTWRERYLTFQLPSWLCCCFCCCGATKNKFQLSFFRTWCIKSHLNLSLTALEIMLTWVTILTGTF